MLLRGKNAPDYLVSKATGTIHKKPSINITFTYDIFISHIFCNKNISKSYLGGIRNLYFARDALRLHPRVQARVIPFHKVDAIVSLLPKEMRGILQTIIKRTLALS